MFKYLEIRVVLYNEMDKTNFFLLSDTNILKNFSSNTCLGFVYNVWDNELVQFVIYHWQKTFLVLYVTVFQNLFVDS